MNAGPSGFHNAPVTKVVVLVCGLASVLIGMQGGAKSCSLSYQAILKKLHLWRILTSTCVFSSTPELFFGLYLVYFFRVFERQNGSNKYAMFVLLSTIITTILECVVLIVLKDPSSVGLSPGPYALIFSSFVPFFFDIPITTRFHIFGARFSDKAFVYLAGFQLLLSAWKRSLIPGICGILAGLAYRMNVLGIRRMKFPAVVASATTRLFSPFFSSAPFTATPRPDVRETINAQFGQPYEGRLAAAAPPLAPVLPPSEESIATLVAMGFDRNRVLQALAQARNDLTIATNILLESQS
eukprot:c23356_g1_i1 orf=299-1189(+)